MDLSNLYADLNESDRQEIEALPRAERLEQIATLRNQPTQQLLEELARACKLPLVKEFELLDNPTEAIPLRLIFLFL